MVVRASRPRTSPRMPSWRIRRSTVCLETPGMPVRASQAIGPKVGVGVESLRQWTVQAQIDAQQVPGPTTAERQRIKDLEREVRDLKEANEILKAASIFFARELDPRHR